MARIRPFKALRPAHGYADKIASLPYDVFSREEAREEVKDNKYSFLNIDRPETQFPVTQDMYAKEVYEKAASMLSEMEAEGLFVQDEHPSYYVYEMSVNGRSQTGIVAASSVDDYEGGVIRKHEKTLEAKRGDRINHVDICSAQTGPIFLAYRDSDAVNEIVSGVKKGEPAEDFVSGGVRQRVWVVSDNCLTDRITKAFEAIPYTYIADGHHRAASAVQVSQMRRKDYPAYSGKEEFNYFLSVLFPAGDLEIMDYNRVIKSLGGFTAEEMIEGLRTKVFIEYQGDKRYKPTKKGTFGLYMDYAWYKLTVRPEYVKDDPVEKLDVAYLQREILGPVFGITDPVTDKRIEFIGGIRGLDELERRCHTDCKAAFAMYPTTIDELFDVADAGMLMPPKSTWFEPKLLSGLFIHKIERSR